MARQVSMEIKVQLLGCLGAVAAEACSACYYKKRQEEQLKRLVKAAETAAQKSTYLERTAQKLQRSRDLHAQLCKE